MQNIAVVYGECNSILFALITNVGEMVVWWKGSPETNHARPYTVSSRASLLDPGSSLLETTTRPKSNRPLYNPNPRESALFIPVYLREPPDQGSSAQGWQSPFATETGGLFQTGNSVASAERTSAALMLSALIYVNRLTSDQVL
ncbi:MAG TPA: hypothetical protein PK802_02325 [Candidatus Cloacimonadota bacterium]|jgi:hypothetical protein|nr:hypothetical protein [Candidatus Cloacimonadota bacterium]HOF59224.1 hypothetical protein [Candidatus Cloacimonadota bacterium]HOR58457.1 hypothetical protein [Candidatus Cloacimonadota bacterium]HPB08510.1 hypothetical protein [Candidatus Cloacimonadota bacterium]HQO43983.1 hypothetical protein [Candidatus Cloacimonadota bacterium]